MVAESIATSSLGEASHQARSERPSPRHTFEDDKDDIWNFEGQNCIRRELLVSPIADRVHEVTSIVLSLDDSKLYSAKFTRVLRSRALASGPHIANIRDATRKYYWELSTFKDITPGFR
jgi:hypothetical protein